VAAWRDGGRQSRTILRLYLPRFDRHQRVKGDTGMYILAIDQGTSQTKALIMDASGRVLASNSAPIQTRIIGESQIEQDPFEILASVRAACVPLLDQYPATIAGLDNQGETFLLWDARDGTPLTPAISWQDKRGSVICTELEQAGYAALIRERTGLLLDSYFSAPKLAALLRRSPELRRRAEAGTVCFGTIDTWIVWMLGVGQPHITDPSTAVRTLLLDARQMTWDPELLTLFDIPAVLLPQVVPSAGPVAELRIADHTLELHALLCDQTAALFGQACLAPGQAKCSFGTGAFMLLNTGEQLTYSTQGLLSTIAWQTPAATHYALDGGIFTAGAAVEWLRDGLGVIANSAESGMLAERADPATTPICIPALAGLAAPYWRPEARGTLFGLSRGSGRAELVRATLEGLAMRVGDVLLAMQADAGLAIPYLRVDGGPARNRFLMQTIADDLGVAVEIAAEVESTAAGIAQMARHSALGVPYTEIAAAWRGAAVYFPQISVDQQMQRRARWERAVSAALEFYLE
jgi:glycerol kinase